MRLEEISFPPGSDDEKELLLQWLNYMRGAVLRNIEGLDDAQARRTPNGKLIPLLGIVNHLAKVEWRWIEGGFSGADVSRTEKEFTPGQDVTLREVIYARGYSSDRTTPGQLISTAGLPAGDPWSVGVLGQEEAVESSPWGWDW